MEFRGAEKPYQFLASSSSHFASYETARSQFSTDDFWASVRSVKQDQGKREQNPQEKANYFSLLTFWWLNWIINTGYKRPLEDKDLWALRREDQASYIVPRLKKKWLEQQRKCRRLNAKETEEKEGNNEDNDCKETDRLLADEGDRQKKKRGKKMKDRNPSLAKTLWNGLFGVDFAKAVMFQLLNDLLVFIQPQLLRLLVEYTDREHKSDLFGEWKEWKGYLYAGAMLVTACIQSLAFGQFVYLMNTIGMRINTALIGLVYEKALVVKFKSHGESTTGELVNLMSVDAQRVMRVMTFINNFWSSPLRIGVALYLLYNTLGISVLAGIGVVLLALPLFGVFSSRMFALQGEQMTKKDERLKLINEVLKGMKVLKLYAWEQSFMRQIKQTRNKELRILRNMGFWFSGLLFLFNTAPTLIFIVTFIVYVFTGQQLIASKAFYALSLINVMSVPLLAFPDIISALIMAKVSLKRLQNFLNTEELDPSNVQKIKFSPSAVAIENASFAWSVKDAPVLRQISLRIPSGSLIAIVGQVGSGKSTLLSAILGETEKLQGRVSVQGSVAYVSQQAWIQHNTVRENILFGKAYDSTRYEQVIDSCALRPDLDILQAGDSTEIGERGINLSGGQKQRVSLARAVYFNADIYLLDDPLSAVDTHVGKHIFDKVVGPRGILKNKTRLLVTHGVHFLPQVDQIIVIEDGRISECGTYSELLANSGAFAEFLQTYASENHSSNSSGQLERSISRDAAKTSNSANVDAVKDLQKPDEEEKGKIIDKELSETGRVKFSVLLSYLKSMGICITVATLIFALLMEACKVCTRFWLAYWIIETKTTNDPRNFYVGVYGGITLGQVLFSVLTFTLIVVGAQRASRRLHNKLLENIMRAPMSFFDTTPLGRIVNRFSNDMDVIDEGLYQIWSLFLSVLLDLFGIIVAIGYTTPLFLLVLPLLGALYFYFQKVFVASSRQLKRIESVRRSPIYSHFLETINGASTIRAFSQQQRFIRDNYHRTDENQVAYYLSIASNSWLPVRLHFIGGFLTLFAALFAVISRDTIFSALVGMSLTFSLETTEVLNMLVLMTSLLETELVSVERVKEYSAIDTEAEWIKPDNRPPDDWPNTGGVVIEEFDLRYREGLPLVLKQINCDIKPGEKIGVVGRTGAGKSSLTLALFRILERAGGRILIDGIDVATIGLQDLRSRLTIIPQEPVLFCGSIRFNLDPFNKHSDDELWTVMEVSHLKSFVSGLNDGLQHKITEGGENLSVGQRQLLCLARALLRDSKVLVLDEATAAVDLETDDLIQQTIRREFADRTVFTIAHRLNTIMDYDRILVLDNGVIFEFDTPEKLLKQESLFMKMAKAANLA